MGSQQLKRIIGTPTALLLGMGVAIGSGIFRTPGDVAALLKVGWLIILAWIVGGCIASVQGMVSAELATRFPKAGGEYVFLREAYGEFVAFFFGWAYTVFVIGGGAATISLAFGDFACDLFAVTGEHSGWFAAGAIVFVTTVNAIGLRTGAGAQNAMTLLKIAALLSVVAIGLAFGGASSSPAPTAPPAAGSGPTLSVFLAAVLAVLWAYDGTTDSVKMAEEIKGVRKAIPRAVIGSALAVTVLYCLVNASLLNVLAPAEMARTSSVPGEAMGRLFGNTGRRAMLIVAMLVCLGSVASTVLATVRVTFALARDGLTFRFMARMSSAQSPVAALIVVSGFAVFLVLNRDFSEVLKIYYFASAFLFGLVYASLIVFRLRESHFPATVFRCPLGMVQAGFLIAMECVIAIGVALDSPRDAAYTGLLFIAIGGLYVVWKRFAPQSKPFQSDPNDPQA